MASKDDSGAVAYVLACAMGVVLLVFLRGFALKCMWGWFVMPLGVMALSFWHALGLSVTLLAFTGRSSSTDPKESFGMRVAVAICVTLLLLGVAWLIAWGV